MSSDSSSLSLIKSYWRVSKSPFYSLIFILPLLLAYELMIFTVNRSDILGLRNGADILVRQFFSLFHVYGFYFVGFIVLIAFGLSYYFHTRKEQNIRFSGKFFILMILESALYALLMLFIVTLSERYLISAITTNEGYLNIILALGAGVYEEFIFRVILVSGFLFFLRDVLKMNSVISIFISIAAASLLFSVFHYIGSYGETFEFKSFAIRFGAGVFLSILYAFRGYGITAYTHTLYDLFVILL